jgi:hypothetical protein
MGREASVRAATLGVCALALLGAGPALAHHSFAMFDHVHRITVAGDVTRFDWTNPHVYIELTAPDGKGGQARYTIECASPNVLTRVGWKFNTVKVGDKVSALINPLKNGEPGGMLETLTTPDGKTLSDSNPPSGNFER